MRKNSSQVTVESSQFQTIEMRTWPGYLRRSSAARLRRIFVSALLLLAALPFSLPAQNLDKAVQTVDDEVTAFAYGPDGRQAFEGRE